MYVLGTAGHVDHGKSTLIQALTGIDPDRLAEEKRRGLTIDLGFAWLELPSGREVGIVDVPGHERFVHNMLAGAGSIDATIFVVAANEGWMPQSEEHLQILDLLGARGGVVALTKADTVDSATTDRVTKLVSDRLQGTILEAARIVPVAAPKDFGMDDLRDAIDELLEHTQQAHDNKRPRLFVDRSFTIKGSGTVVTGTLTDGFLRAGDEVVIAPSGARTHVRSIQTHKQQRSEAEPGSRVALNLTGLERHEIRRGDAVVKPGQWLPTSLLGVRMTTVRSLGHPITSRGAYKLYIGAAELDARLTILDTKTVRAGDRAFARVTLSEPVVATEGDRFVLRDASRDDTVGGGVILDAHPVPGRVSREVLLERLVRRAAGNPGAMAIAERGAIATGEALALTGSENPSGTVKLRSYLADQSWLQSAISRIDTALSVFHAKAPLEQGMSKEDARRESGIGDARLFTEIIEHAETIAAEGALVRLTSHVVRLSPEENAHRLRLLKDAAGLAPESRQVLEERFGRMLVQALIASGDLVPVSPGFVFTASAVEEAKVAIRELIEREGPATASRIREALGTSRKYAIPLLEYLDSSGFTRREGDTRSLR